MYKHLYDKFNNWYHGGQIYFYSDPHFSDPEMPYIRHNYVGDEEQVKRINKIISKNDTLVILGDICDIDYIKKLHGYKVLVCGNHDVGATKYKRKIITEEFDKDLYSKSAILKEMENKYPGYNLSHCIDDTLNSKYIITADNKLFDEVYEGALIISDKLIISHEPINYPFALNIHGHDHSGNCDDMHINVCAEWINYRPVSLKDIVSSGKLKNITTIHRHTIDEASAKKKKDII